MPYSPRVSGTGAEFLFHGISSAGKDIGEGIEAFVERRRESGAVRDRIDRLAMRARPLVESKELTEEELEKFYKVYDMPLEKQKAALTDFDMLLEDKARLRSEKLAQRRVSLEEQRVGLEKQQLEQQKGFEERRLDVAERQAGATEENARLNYLNFLLGVEKQGEETRRTQATANFYDRLAMADRAWNAAVALDPEAAKQEFPEFRSPTSRVMWAAEGSGAADPQAIQQALEYAQRAQDPRMQAPLATQFVEDPVTGKRVLVTPSEAQVTPLFDRPVANASERRIFPKGQPLPDVSGTGYTFIPLPNGDWELVRGEEMSVRDLYIDQKIREDLGLPPRPARQPPGQQEPGGAKQPAAPARPGAPAEPTAEEQRKQVTDRAKEQVWQRIKKDLSEGKITLEEAKRRRRELNIGD